MEHYIHSRRHSTGFNIRSNLYYPVFPSGPTFQFQSLNYIWTFACTWYVYAYIFRIRWFTIIYCDLKITYFRYDIWPFLSNKKIELLSICCCLSITYAFILFLRIRLKFTTFPESEYYKIHRAFCKYVSSNYI